MIKDEVDNNNQDENQENVNFSITMPIEMQWKLDDIVTKRKRQGEKKANRSLIIREIILNFFDK